MEPSSALLWVSTPEHGWLPAVRSPDGTIQPCDGIDHSRTEPLPEQPFLPLEITDDDIKQAIKRFSNTFTLVKAAKKWKSKLGSSQKGGLITAKPVEISIEEERASQAVPSDGNADKTTPASAPMLKTESSEHV